MTNEIIAAYLTPVRWLIYLKEEPKLYKLCLCKLAAPPLLTGSITGSLLCGYVCNVWLYSANIGRDQGVVCKVKRVAIVSRFYIPTHI